MKIIHINDKLIKGIMVRINKEEALEIAISLLSQVRAGNSVSGRKEHYTDKEEYFSIAVVNN